MSLPDGVIVWKGQPGDRGNFVQNILDILPDAKRAVCTIENENGEIHIVTLNQTVNGMILAAGNIYYQAMDWVIEENLQRYKRMAEEQEDEDDEEPL